MDKYTKFLLTIIAVGIMGINFHLFRGEIITSAQASSNQVHKIAICEDNGRRCADIANVKGGDQALFIYRYPRSR